MLAKLKDKARTLQFAALALALFVVVFGLGLQDSAPGVQATLYYVANILLRATLGYWIARAVLGRIERAYDGFRKVDHDDGTWDLHWDRLMGAKLLARAIVVAAVVLTSR